MKSKSGFTLVEVLVVVVVISILASVVTLAFNAQQRQSRDSKRATDILTLSEEFERYYQENGNYPFTCNLAVQATENNNMFTVMNCMSDRFNSIYYGVPHPDVIHRTYPLKTIQNIFPNLSESFGDPRAPSGQNPINAAPSDFAPIPHTSYFVFSPDLAPNHVTHRSGRVNFRTEQGTIMVCHYTMQPNIRGQGSTRPHQYVTGYYSEVDSSWQFFISEDRSDVSTLQWGTAGSTSQCSAQPVSSLKHG